MPLSKKQRQSQYRKPSKYGNGDNSKELVDLAGLLIRKGMTRQAAYAEARRQLSEPFGKVHNPVVSGGKSSSK